VFCCGQSQCSAGRLQGYGSVLPCWVVMLHTRSGPADEMFDGFRPCHRCRTDVGVSMLPRPRLPNITKKEISCYKIACMSCPINLTVARESGPSHIVASGAHPGRHGHSTRLSYGVHMAHDDWAAQPIELPPKHPTHSSLSLHARCRSPILYTTR
jgi:hypothetical protein